MLAHTIKLSRPQTAKAASGNSRLTAAFRRREKRIQLCLAITAQALNQRCASRIKTQTTNEAYTFRTWLLRMGMIGDEFKTARKHLLEHLEGGIAWRDPAQAQRQRERLQAQRQQMQGPTPLSLRAMTIANRVRMRRT